MLDWLTDHKIPIGKTAKTLFDWLQEVGEPFFDWLSVVMEGLIDAILFVLQTPHPLIVIAAFAALTYALQRSWKPALLIAIGFLFILMGRRLGAYVEGCNYPGHFLTRIQSHGVAYLVDCFHGGRRFDIGTLLESHPEISERARRAVDSPAHLGLILVRYLTELQYTLTASGRGEDAELFKQLLLSL